LEHDRDVGLAGGDLNRQLDGPAAVGLLLDAFRSQLAAVAAWLERG
jgi:hypothetical protein